MHIHFIGIGGTAMGSVALACLEQGHTVTGSDGPLYPPMSTVLDAAGIERSEAFSAERLKELRPDLVVIGNAISRGNPELEFVLEMRWPYTSMAALVGEQFISRNHSIVCAGTHGKTTTTSITAWLLESAELSPGFLVGGVPGNFTVGCRPVPYGVHNTMTGVFVSEGDEYDTAFFDKRSKFVHYRPTVAIVNNVEFDHADIFDSVDDIVRSFRHMIRLIPQSGVVLVNADDSIAISTTTSAPCPVETVGLSSQATWSIENAEYTDGLQRFSLVKNGQAYGTFAFPMPGIHNVRNAAMAIAATHRMGLTPEEQAEGLLRFLPPKRRLEKIGQWNGCTVVDDFAHHPTAIAATIEALSQQYPTSRIHVVFEPRSNTTTRNFFQHELAHCFAGAASVYLGPVHRPERYSESERLDTEALLATLRTMGITSHSVPSHRSSDPAWGADVVPLLADQVQQGDVVAILSNGSVGGLRALLTAQ